MLRSVPGTVTARFTVEGDPVSKQRARTVTRDGRSSSYTPAKTKDAEEAVRGYYLAGERNPVGTEDSRYRVEIRFYRKNRTRKDIDNLAKLVLDALNGLEWADDTQIDELHLWREHDAERPRTEVIVQVLP